MKCIAVALAASVLVAGLATSVEAQAKTTSFYVGGGASLPQGEYGDYAKTGWMGTAGLLYNATDKLWIAAEGMYGSNKHSDVAGDKTDLIGADANFGYLLSGGNGKMSPYVTGGLGMLNHKYTAANGASESESKGMFYGGAGLYFPMGKNGFWIEGRYVKRGDTAFIPILVGFSLHLSGGK
jgi:hypothetical protein